MFPASLPPAVDRLTESTSIQLAAQIRQEVVQMSPQPIKTSFVQMGSGLPVLLLHGFDSSVFEFRRLLPLLAPEVEAWAVDMLGFGFTERPATQIDPAAIKQHLHAFWQQFIQRPMVLAGASMGGAAAIDFALTYPEAVSQLVLLDSAGFAAGPAMGSLMFPPLDRWATAFLRNPWVRRKISQQAYCDRRYVTPDAELCAALHLECSDWSRALIAFTKSGGYNFLQDKIAEIACPTLIIWGQQDRILGIRDAHRFKQAIPDSQLVWIDNCGHVPHLEAPAAAAEAIFTYLDIDSDRGQHH